MKFIIFTAGRSGSTMFQYLLNSSKDCICAGESYGGGFVKKFMEINKIYDQLSSPESYATLQNKDSKHPYYSPPHLLSPEFKKNIISMKHKHLKEMINIIFPQAKSAGMKILLHSCGLKVPNISLTVHHAEDFKSFLNKFIEISEDHYIIFLIRNAEKLLKSMKNKKWEVYDEQSLKLVQKYLLDLSKQYKNIKILRLEDIILKNKNFINVMEVFNLDDISYNIIRQKIN